MDDRLSKLTEPELTAAGASPTAPDRTGARDTAPDRTSPEGAGLSMAPSPGYGSRPEAITMAPAHVAAAAPSSHTDVLRVANGSATRTAASRIDFAGANGSNGHA